MKFKYRLRFLKLGSMRFIGHLDLIKLFQRCIKRAKLPVAYSEGFNPHSLLSFALPLSLGMSSFGEYAELTLLTEIPADILMERLNATLPEGLEIVKARRMLQDEKSAASLVAGGLYELYLPGANGLTNAVSDLLEAESVIVTNPKKNNSEINIRPHIFALEVIGENEVRGLISAGSANHLKPEFLGRALYEKMRITPEPFSMRVIRKELYKRTEPERVPAAEPVFPEGKLLTEPERDPAAEPVFPEGKLLTEPERDPATDGGWLSLD